MAAGPLISGTHNTVNVILLGMNGEPHLVLTQKDIENITRGDVKIYIIGFVSYTDEYSILESTPSAAGFLLHHRRPK